MIGKLLLFSHSVMSSSLWPHGLQHSRLPCPSPTLRVCSNSCPLSQRCYLTISSLSSPSPPAFNLFQHRGLFQWVDSASGGQSIGASASASVLPMNIHGWFPWELIDLISLLSKDSQESSPTPQFKSINSLALSLLFIVQLSHPYMTIGKTIVKNHWLDEPLLAK